MPWIKSSPSSLLLPLAHAGVSLHGPSPLFRLVHPHQSSVLSSPRPVGTRHFSLQKLVSRSPALELSSSVALTVSLSCSETAVAPTACQTEIRPLCWAARAPPEFLERIACCSLPQMFGVASEEPPQLRFISSLCFPTWEVPTVPGDPCQPLMGQTFPPRST